MANWTGELQKAEFKVADENSTKSFYVDNLPLKKMMQIINRERYPIIKRLFC